MGAIETKEAATGRTLKEDSTLVNLADKTEEMLGGKGAVVITDMVAHVPATGQCFQAINVLTDALINAYIVDASAPITGSLVGATFLAGSWIYGKFTSLTLGGGTVLAYNGVL